MTTGNFTAGVVATPPLTVNQFFTTPPATPGNVGVCLSGGGSRALTAGMGQLQALAYLTVDGAPLLGQVKALSTVSGGSWLGVRFVYLRPSGPSDAAFLGTFNPDQASLTSEQLAVLPAGNACVPITSDFFLPELLALEAFLLYEFLHVPPSMLWQTVIALNLLKPCGLFSPGTDFEPTDLFSYDQQSLQAAVTGPNPALAGETADLVAHTTASGRIHRPYLICNMNMFLKEPNTAVEMQAPVQATPFSPALLEHPRERITTINRWAAAVSRRSLSTRCSSIRAANRRRSIAEWQANPAEFAKTLLQYADEILRWIENHFDPASKMSAKAFVQRHATAATPVLHVAALHFSFAGLQSIEPAYYYWSPEHPAVLPQPLPTRFDDGGSLDNTGINGMLAYADIDALIAFVNSEQPMMQGQYGIADGKGGYIPNTNIVVDDAIPPLFGYQPYESADIDQMNKGYVLYAGASGTDYPMYAKNQVFPSTAFQELLQKIWQNGGAGSNSSPAVYAQTLEVQPNAWFGVKGGKTVTVVWCHLNPVTAWENQFRNNPAVAALVSSAASNMKFPNYDTVNTKLTATEVNLLAALTGWCVVKADEKKVFSGLFLDASGGDRGA